MFTNSSSNMFYQFPFKEKSRDAAAERWLPRPALLLLCVGERHTKLCFLKRCIGHIVQLMDCLLGKMAHICVHVLQGVGDPGKCPVPVGVVVHTDQIFFLDGKCNTAHAHTSKSLFFFFAAAFFGAAAFVCPSLSWLRTDRRGWRRGRLRFSSLLISAKIPRLSFMPDKYRDL